MPKQLSAHKLLLSLLGFAALAAFLVFKTSPITPKSPIEQNRTPAQTAISDQIFSGISFRPRAHQKYTYSFTRKIYFNGLANIPEIVYHGELYLDVTKANASGFEALVSEQIVEHPEKNPSFLRAQINTAGNILKVFSKEDYNEDEKQHVNILKDLLANWVFPLRVDTVGFYEASFSALTNKDAYLQSIKTKSAYTDHSNAVRILKSSHELLWDPALSLPHSVVGTESTELGQGKGITSESSYSIQFVSTTPSTNANQALLAALNKDDSLALAQSKSDLGDNPENKNITWDNISERLRHLTDMKSQEQLQAFGDIVKLLKMHPELISSLVALLSPQDIAQGIHSELFKMIVGSLATDGSAEALTALRNIYQDPKCPVNGKGAIETALTTTQAPVDEATRDFLENEMRQNTNRDLALGAAFALGSSLQNATNNQSTSKAVDAIQAAWEQALAANNLEQELALLDVIGNSGRSDFLPTLENIINSNSITSLKAKAVFSLRFMPSTKASTLIAMSLGNTIPQIREASARAMQLAAWRESFRPPLQICSSSEARPYIQELCQSILQQNIQVSQQ